MNHHYTHQDGTQSLSLLTAWGEGDAHIAEVARSTIEGAATRSRDAALIDHLMRHRHTSPFEFAGLSVTVVAPRFVVAQWMRHRTQSYQELSARYSDLSGAQIWRPIEWRTQGGGPNRQVGDGEVLSGAAAEAAFDIYDAAASHCLRAYRGLVALGACREQARAILPVGFITKFKAAASLHNWLHFLGLRLAPDAQEETQWFAGRVRTIIREYWPATLEAWERHQMYALRLSADEVGCVAPIASPNLTGSRAVEWQTKVARMGSVEAVNDPQQPSPSAER